MGGRRPGGTRSPMQTATPPATSTSPGTAAGVSDTPRIRVKFIHRTSPRVWPRQFPHGRPVWGNCEFLLDPAARDYDWAVVYNDLPPREGERFSRGAEVLACPKRHTVLVTTEPSPITTYGKAYTAQFGYVLTSQEPWALPHPGRIYSQPALLWFYGVGSDHVVPYDAMAAAPPPEKTRLISTVCSTKRQRHTLHRRRVAFTWRLKAALPELDVFGHGVRPMDDKAEALDPYRYHVAIENHVAPHHWTEKLADPFLGYALPFYCGCPNAADYFPPESFVPIDINDFDGALRVIRQTIAEDGYAKRLPHIVEARRRVLEEHNIFAVLAREIEKRHGEAAEGGRGALLYARRAARRHYPLRGLGDLLEKGRRRLAHLVRPPG
jgi:Glycosyltransferase family 10 (fucosyltransferase) C-term